MFYIIKDLGPTAFQVTNNLKIFITAILMRILLFRKISWIRWKALIILAAGSVVTQLKCEEAVDQQLRIISYCIVLLNVLASGAGSVISELLLKGTGEDTSDSIHWKNMQLYSYGILFGCISYVQSTETVGTGNAFEGFNWAAWATVASLTIMGISVSFVLKHIDNIAKCFVTVLSMLAVALIQATLENDVLTLKLCIGVCLSCLAIEQYNLSP